MPARKKKPVEPPVEPTEGEVALHAVALAVAEAEARARHEAKAEYEPQLEALREQLRAVRLAATGTLIDIDPSAPFHSPALDDVVECHRDLRYQLSKVRSLEVEVAKLKTALGEKRPARPVDPSSLPVWA